MRFLAIQKASLVAAVCAVSLGLISSARASVRELVGKLPGDANALIAIDVEAVAASPVAVAQKWFEKSATDQPLFIPRGSKQVVVATQLNAAREVNFGVSLADLKEPISIDRLALAEGGRKETIGEKPAVASPGNAYFIQLDDTRLATVFPADRQAATRVATGYHRGIASPYLLKSIEGGSPLVMAIDADGILSAGDVFKNIDARPLKTLEDNSIDLRTYSKLLASIKGVALKVAFTDDVSGEVTIDFGNDTAPIAGVVKPLVIETLSRVGLNVVEFSNWKFSASGKRIVGEGKLTLFTLKRLLSLADAPVPATLDPETPADEAAPAAADATLAASKAYFKKATAILDNIKKAPSLGEQGTWLRRDARRLADLPVLNVDPELVAWGSATSDKMFAAARQLSGGQMTVRTSSDAIAAPGVPSSSSNDGYYYSDNNDAQYGRDMENWRRQRRAATGAEYDKAVRAAAEQIDGLAAGRTEIRQKMTDKYKVEFK